MSPKESKKWRDMTIKLASFCVGLRGKYDLSTANCEMFVTLMVVLPMYYHWQLDEENTMHSLTASVKPICVSVKLAEEGIKAEKPLGLTSRIQCPGKYRCT